MSSFVVKYSVSVTIFCSLTDGLYITVGVRINRYQMVAKRLKSKTFSALSLSNTCVSTNESDLLLIDTVQLAGLFTSSCLTRLLTQTHAHVYIYIFIRNTSRNRPSIFSFVCCFFFRLCDDSSSSLKSIHWTIPARLALVELLIKSNQINKKKEISYSTVAKDCLIYKQECKTR